MSTATNSSFFYLYITSVVSQEARKETKTMLLLKLLLMFGLVWIIYAALGFVICLLTKDKPNWHWLYGMLMYGGTLRNIFGTLGLLATVLLFMLACAAFKNGSGFVGFVVLVVTLIILVTSACLLISSCMTGCDILKEHLRLMNLPFVIKNVANREALEGIDNPSANIIYVASNTKTPYIYADDNWVELDRSVLSRVMSGEKITPADITVE